MKYPVVRTTTMKIVWMWPKYATKSDVSIVIGRRPTKPKIFTYGNKNCEEKNVRTINSITEIFSISITSKTV